MMQGHHCMDNSTVCRKVKTTDSSCVHQINTAIDFKIPGALWFYISTIIPYSGNEF